VVSSPATTLRTTSVAVISLSLLVTTSHVHLDIPSIATIQFAQQQPDKQRFANKTFVFVRQVWRRRA
jgi:hypothetical protein